MIVQDTCSEWLAGKLTASNSPYAGAFHVGLEVQVMPTDDEDLLARYSTTPHRYRVPRDGNTAPINNDRRAAIRHGANRVRRHQLVELERRPDRGLRLRLRLRA